jgi:hypothetical protein
MDPVDLAGLFRADLYPHDQRWAQTCAECLRAGEEAVASALFAAQQKDDLPPSADELEHARAVGRLRTWLRRLEQPGEWLDAQVRTLDWRGCDRHAARRRRAER